MALLVFWKHALLVLGYGIGFELLSCTKTKANNLKIMCAKILQTECKCERNLIEILM